MVMARQHELCASGAVGPQGHARTAVREARPVAAPVGALLLVLAAGGCASLRPATLSHDRANYITA
jgi:hypothetical protein